MNQIINTSNTVETTRIVKLASSQEKLQTVKNNISQLLSSIELHGAAYAGEIEDLCQMFDEHSLTDKPTRHLLGIVSNYAQKETGFSENSSRFLFVTGLMKVVLDNISKQQTTSLEDMKKFFLKEREVLNTRCKEFEAFAKESLVDEDKSKEIATSLIKQLKNVNLVLIEIIQKQPNTKELESESEIKALKKDSRILTKIKKDIEKSRQSQNSEIASSVQKSVTFFNNMNKEQPEKYGLRTLGVLNTFTPEQRKRAGFPEHLNAQQVDNKKSSVQSSLSQEQLERIDNAMFKNLQGFEENSAINKPTIDDMLFGGIIDSTPCLKPEQLTRDNSSVEKNNSGNTSSTETKTSSNVLRKRFGKVQGEMMEKFGITIDSAEKSSFIQGKINFFNDIEKEKSQENKTHSLRSSNSSVGSGQVKNLTNLFEKNTFNTNNFSSINETSSKNPRTSTPLSKGRQRHDSYESVDSGISLSGETTTTFSNNKGTSVNLGSTQNRLMKEFGIPSVKQPQVKVGSLVNKFNQFSEGLLSKDRQRHDSHESVDSGISLSGEATNVSDLIKKFEGKESSTRGKSLSGIRVSELIKKFEVGK